MKRYDICYENKIDREREEPNIRPKSATSPTSATSVTPLTPVKTPDIEVFPNPTDGNLTVSISELPEGTVTFQLFDVLGHNILSQSLTDHNSTIILSQFPQGVYYYQIMNNGVSIKSDRVVKR